MSDEVIRIKIEKGRDFPTLAQLNAHARGRETAGDSSKRDHGVRTQPKAATPAPKSVDRGRSRDAGQR